MFDGLFDYTDGPFRGRCHLTIFAPEGERITVLLTEINHPKGRTVTNAIEAIATEVVGFFGLNPEQLSFVQQVPREEYFAVHLRWESGFDGGFVATAPEWQPCVPSEAMLQRGTDPLT